MNIKYKTVPALPPLYELEDHSGDPAYPADCRFQLILRSKDFRCTMKVLPESERLHRCYFYEERHMEYWFFPTEQAAVEFAWENPEGVVLPQVSELQLSVGE